MPNKKLGLIAIFVSVAAGQIWAGTLSSYAVGDVLLCFRKSGRCGLVAVLAGGKNLPHIARNSRYTQ